MIFYYIQFRYATFRNVLSKCIFVNYVKIAKARSNAYKIYILFRIKLSSPGRSKLYTEIFKINHTWLNSTVTVHVQCKSIKGYSSVEYILPISLVKRFIDPNRARFLYNWRHIRDNFIYVYGITVERYNESICICPPPRHYLFAVAPFRGPRHRNWTRSLFRSRVDRYKTLNETQPILGQIHSSPPLLEKRFLSFPRIEL